MDSESESAVDGFITPPRRIRLSLVLACISTIIGAACSGAWFMSAQAIDIKNLFGRQNATDTAIEKQVAISQSIDSRLNRIEGKLDIIIPHIQRKNRRDD